MSRIRVLVGLLGCVSALAYALILWLSFQFHYGEGYAGRPIIPVLLVLGSATVLYLIALAVLLTRLADFSTLEQQRTSWLIVGFALVFRAILLPSEPIQEIDYYRYLWDGRVTLHGFNPYQYSLQDIEELVAQGDPSSDFTSLADLSQQSEAVQTIFARVHHRHVPTVYPPAAQAVFAMSALITPAAAPLWVHTLILKSILLVFDVGTLFVLIALLRSLNMPTVWCLAYGWCPLALKEFANSGHLDSIAIFFTTLAGYLLVRGLQAAASVKSSWPVRSILGGAIALGLGILSKTYPLILLPIIGALVIRRWAWRGWAAFALTCTVVAAGYVPFLAPISHGLSTSVVADSHNPWTGLGTFLSRWQMNDLLFMIVHENLRDPVDGAPLWFVVVPEDWRSSLNNELRAQIARASDIDPSFLLTQAIMGLAVASLCGWQAWQVWKKPESRVFLRGCFLILVWGWLLSSAQNPWYLLWCLPLMVFESRRSWFLLPGLVLLYYLRFWLEYQALDDAVTYWAALAGFDFGWVWLEYTPFFLLLLAETVWVRQRGNNHSQLFHGHKADPAASKSIARRVA